MKKLLSAVLSLMLFGVIFAQAQTQNPSTPNKQKSILRDGKLPATIDGNQATIKNPSLKVDDATVTSNVKAKLDKSKYLKDTKLDVKTTNGVVTIAGKLKEFRQANVAIMICRTVQGVKQINNQLDYPAKSRKSLAARAGAQQAPANK